MPLLDWLNKDHAAIGNEAPFAEHQRVRLLRDVACGRYSLRRGMLGTVVSVYAGGEAYAVEFPEPPGGMGVMTLRHADIESASA